MRDPGRSTAGSPIRGCAPVGPSAERGRCTRHPRARLDEQRSIERFNRTLATEWTYRQVHRTNGDRTLAFTTWLVHDNTERRHYAVGAAPITRLSPTS